MTDITIETGVDLSDLNDDELHRRLGEIERVRYRIADQLKAIMDEFENRGAQ